MNESRQEKMNNIQEELFKLQDKKYREMQIKIIPTINPDVIIGVRTPNLRSLAKELVKSEYIVFIKDLPHQYFDENQLHAFIISQIKDFDECLSFVNAFLPYIDNWATCDQMSPKVFKKYPNELLQSIKKWIKSKKTYTIRFGISMLMQHFLDDNFNIEYLEMVANIKSEEYYVNMMRAWFFATALAKQYDSTLPFIENYKLDTWTHNKTIQKAIESYRISVNQKEYLKSLKIKPA